MKTLPPPRFPAGRAPRGTLRAALAAACLCGLAFGSLAPPAAAKGPNADAPDANTDPEVERKAFKLADGFEVNLFAADPQVEKPIEINFDAAGRLWVATSETYPQVKPGQVPDDKVIVLEDTTGSGRADKSTVFAGGLLIPTGIAPGDGGVYVANSTEIDFLKDTTGSGKADSKRVVLAGFGTEDTHHIVHAFRWGPDGRLYFNQSIYIHSTLETPHGTKRLYGGGVWRFEPQTMDLDVFVTGLVNGWGDVWDRWGNAFGTDGAGGEGINYFIPGAAFTATPNTKRVLAGLNPKSPKYASIEVLSGRAMPEDVRGDLITNDFRANRVVRFKLSDAGAGFAAKLEPDFITSTDKAFRPVDVKMGPDGALYIADWYNPIIQHGEVDFRDPRRDHAHGRIWRVTAKGRTALPRPRLVGAPVSELLNHLLDPEDWTRLQAKLVMRERGAQEVVPELAKWVKGLDKRDAKDAKDAKGATDPKDGARFDAEHARLEALWTYECVDAPEPKLLERVLHSPDARARAAAALIVAHWSKALDNPADLLAPLVGDEDPRVRLMAVRSLAALATPAVVPLAAKVLDKPMDPFLDYALYKTCTDLEPVWLPAFKAGKLSNWGSTAHLTYALQAVQSPDAMGMVVKQLEDGQVPPESMRDVFDLIGAVGGPKEVGEMLAAGAGADKADKNDDATKAAALKAAERAARQRRVVPAPALELRPLIESKDPALAAQAIRLTGALRLTPERAALEKLASEPATPESVRMAAVEALAEMGQSPREAEPLFEKLAAATNPPAVRAGGVAGLTYVDVKAAAPKAAEWLAGAPAGADPAPVLSAFLRKEGGPDALAAALSGKTLSPDAAKLSLRYLQGVGQAAPALTDVLKKQAGVATTSKVLSPDEMKQLMAEVAAKGDAAHGEQVFRSKVTNCYGCHAIGGAGGTLAPDLRAIGASAPVDYLINSVLLPNKDIKDGFDSLIVSTRDGDLVQGIKVREDARELVLRDNIRDEIVIPADQIKGRKDGGSLMPAGLADPLTHQEFVDLVRFLSELGKPGPYAVTDAPVVRRWRVLDPVPESAAADQTRFPAGDSLGWYPAYSTVAGVLPAEALPTAAAKPVAFAQAQIEVAAAGKVRLAFNSLKGLSLWADGSWVDLGGAKQPEVGIDLGRGLHTLTIRVDAGRRGGEGLRLEVGDAGGSAGSSAHAQPVGGK